jgi:hypothetical protein
MQSLKKQSFNSTMYEYNALPPQGYGVTLHPGTRLLIKSAATWAFDLPTSERLQKN